MIHETSILAEDATIGRETVIGPFCVLGVDGNTELEPLDLGANSTIRSHTVIYRGTSIGPESAFGHGVLVRENCSIGTSVSVGSHTVLEHSVTVESHVRLHSNCFVPEESVLEEGAWLGPGVIVTNARYPNRPDTKLSLEGVRVGKGATIGAGVILMPGVSIGSGALVGAGAVVLQDVGSEQRIVGNPGRTL